MHPATAKPSAIPKVIGTLMIIAGSIAVMNGIYGAIQASGNGIDLVPRQGSLLALFQDDPTVATVKRIGKLVGVLVGLLELVGGIALVLRRRRGIPLAIAYASVHMATGIALAAVLFALRGPTLHGMLGTVFNLFGAVALPTVVLALVTRPSAKAACRT